MRWDIGCEAYYDNMLDFRQLHKKRHHKMSKWPVNHDVCCSPFSQGWPLWQALTANKKGAVRRNKSAQTSCTCLYSEATFVPVVWPSSPLKDSVRHTASLMYCDDTTLCVSATSAPAAVKATTAMITPPQQQWWHHQQQQWWHQQQQQWCTNNNSSDGTYNNSSGGTNNNSSDGNSNREWQYLAHMVPGQVECWGRIPFSLREIHH